MLASSPASMLNQNRPDSGIPNRFYPNSSRSSKRAGPGWRAFCASLTETDSAKREGLRGEARAAWTGIGALGLVRDYLDFRMELKP